MDRDLGWIWVRRGLVAALAVGSLAVLAVSFLGGDEDERHQLRTLVRVRRARSGDTVVIAGDQKLVYAGIRAPFLGEPLFEEAKRRNAELVEGKKVRLRYEKERYDPDGRLCAYVSDDDSFVNQALVREGLAYVRLGSGMRRFADDLLAAQNEARQGKRGLWAQRAPKSADQYLGNLKYGNFHRHACEETAKIRPERLVVFKSRNDAFDEGFAPCGRCRP